MRQIMIEQTHKNPFFEQYHTLHETVPFGDFTLADIEEAFVEGIKRDDELIEKITNNPEKPTFDNTIIYREEGKEHYYAVLDKVSTAFYNLMSAETNDEMDALAQKIQPMLTKHANDVRLNPVLFERIKHVHRHHRRLTPEEKVLLEDTYQGLVRSGALLDDEGKEKLGDRGRLVVRPSGTEPLIRIMAEGEDEAFTEAIAKQVAERIEEKLKVY